MTEIEGTKITTTVEDREANITEKALIWVTKRRTRIKSSSKRTALAKLVDTVAADPRRETITGIRGMDATTINTKNQGKKSSMRKSMIKT